MRDDRYEIHGPPHTDRNSDKGEENYNAPRRPLTADSPTHTCYYVTCACKLSTARTRRTVVFETTVPRDGLRWPRQPSAQLLSSSFRRRSGTPLHLQDHSPYRVPSKAYFRAPVR